MKSRERFVIYAVLGLLVLVNLSLVLGSERGKAFAETLLGGLGPAESVILTEEKTGEDMTITNQDGRLSWSDNERDRAYNSGYVHIGKALRQLMKREMYLEEREQLLDELNMAESDFRTQLDALSEQLQGLDSESQEAQALYTKGSSLYEQYMAWQQEAITKRGTLDAEHLERSYQDLVAAVDVVADRMGVDIVHRFIPTDLPFEAQNPEQAMLAIRMRPVLKYPEGLDITDAVLEELSLDLDEEVTEDDG